jgi:hypothetical protein
MDHRERERGLDVGSGPSLRQVAVILGLVFAIALAVVVGKKMSAEAMAVVIGVVCGVAAAVPTSVLLLVVLNRNERQRHLEQDRRPGRTGRYPPVVVIQGGAPQALPPGQQAGYWPASYPAPSAQRQFEVVGGEELIDEGW